MIAEIRLQQYRSYLEKKIKLSSGVNIVEGPNASGKTNLLEAVMFICLGDSFRSADSELVMHGKDWARLDGYMNDGVRTVKLSLIPQAKEYEINNKKYKRLTNNTRIPVVLFEPDHLRMLSGSPEYRRKYLDGILDFLKPGYRSTRNNYIKTLRQRNALLKSGNANTASIFPWNVRLSHLGGFIAASRHSLVEELNKEVGVIYRSLSKRKDTVNLFYRPCVSIDSYESSLLKKLETSTELDKLRGFTAYGPHREDLEVNINDVHVANFASRGENRSITIALKILEANIINSLLGRDPIILLDDVFSELDLTRREALTELLPDRQSIITTTNADTTSSLFKTANKIFLSGVNRQR